MAGLAQKASKMSIEEVRRRLGGEPGSEEGARRGEEEVRHRLGGETGSGEGTRQGEESIRKDVNPVSGGSSLYVSDLVKRFSMSGGQ